MRKERESYIKLVRLNITLVVVPMVCEYWYHPVTYGDTTYLRKAKIIYMVVSFQASRRESRLQRQVTIGQLGNRPQRSGLWENLANTQVVHVGGRGCVVDVHKSPRR